MFSLGSFVGNDQFVYAMMHVHHRTIKPYKMFKAKEELNYNPWFSFLGILSGSLTIEEDI
jgi:hypothetical protein